MTPREAKISDHEYMLERYKKIIQRDFPLRNKWYFYEREKNRELLRWTIEQAKEHKHMIVQLGELPDYI
jgi:hypothetical protein